MLKILVSSMIHCSPRKKRKNVVWDGVTFGGSNLQGEHCQAILTSFEKKFFNLFVIGEQVCSCVSLKNLLCCGHELCTKETSHPPLSIHPQKLEFTIPANGTCSTTSGRQFTGSLYPRSVYIY